MVDEWQQSNKLNQLDWCGRRGNDTDSMWTNCCSHLFLRRKQYSRSYRLQDVWRASEHWANQRTERVEERCMNVGRWRLNSTWWQPVEQSTDCELVHRRREHFSIASSNSFLFLLLCRFWKCFGRRLHTICMWHVFHWNVKQITRYILYWKEKLHSNVNWANCAYKNIAHMK